MNSQGTANFMAMEVDTQNYQYLPRSRYGGGLESTPHDNDPERKKKLFAAVFNPELCDSLFPANNALEHRAVYPLPPEIPFRYNPIHDLESLWWSAVYFVLDMEMKPNSEAVDADEFHPTTQQRHYAEKLFYDASSRLSVMLPTTRFFKHIVQSLHPSLHGIGIALEDVREELTSSYTLVEQNATTIDHNAAEGLHSFVLQTFLEISESLEETDFEVRPYQQYYTAVNSH